MKLMLAGRKRASSGFLDSPVKLSTELTPKAGEWQLYECCRNYYETINN